MAPAVKIRDDLQSMALNLLDDLNSGAKEIELAEEYVVITPKVVPLADRPEALPTEPQFVPDNFSLDHTHMTYATVHEVVSPPKALPTLAPAPPPVSANFTPGQVLADSQNEVHSSSGPQPIGKVDIEALGDHTGQLPSPELGHPALNTSTHHNALFLDSLSPVNKSTPSESILAFSPHTEGLSSTFVQPVQIPDTRVPSMPELKNGYGIYRMHSDLFDMCLKHGLRKLPGLSEEIQAGLWQLDVWLHPEKTSEFTLRNFCLKHNIPGEMAQYKEWWNLQVSNDKFSVTRLELTFIVERD